MKVEEAFKEWDKVIGKINQKVEATAKKTGIIPELKHNLVMDYFEQVKGSTIEARHFKRSEIE